MKLRNRILSGVAIVLGLALISLAAALSYDAPCSPPPTLAADAESMQGVVARCYGAPEVMRVERLARPIPGDEQLLVKVQAAALNPVDWHSLRGSPYIMRLSSGIGTPKDPRVGVDFAGTVAAVGKRVTRFKPGDAVFGGTGGTLAEYVIVRQSRAVALKPDNVTFEQAGSVAVAAVTALQGLRDKGGIKSGDRVLINGASGGVGTFAVQIAKHFGAKVTGVCSTRNIELVRALGADRAIDYTKQDFAEDPERYDIVLDNVGNRSLSDLRHVVRPKGTIVLVGAAKGDWIGPLLGPLKAVVLQPFIEEKIGMFIAELNQSDMQFIGELMRAGEVKPVIDGRYALGDAAKAMTYLERGRARGKVVVRLGLPKTGDDRLGSHID